MPEAYKSTDVQLAYTRLLDEICTWERTTGREMTLLLIPHTADEPLGISISGKPVLLPGSVDNFMMVLGRALEARIIDKLDGVQSALERR